MAVGLRAFGAKGPGWLRRGPWAPFAASFCSQGRVPEPGPRLTSVRQRDGIRSAARPRGALLHPTPPPGVARGRTGLFPVWGEGRGTAGTWEERGAEDPGIATPSPHAESSGGSVSGQCRPLL